MKIIDHRIECGRGDGRPLICRCHARMNEDEQRHAWQNPSSDYVVKRRIRRLRRSGGWTKFRHDLDFIATYGLRQHPPIKRRIRAKYVTDSRHLPPRPQLTST